MSQNILEILKTRRSHFRKEFTGNKVENSVIDYLLECAHQAPTHKLTYPWHFKVFHKESLQDFTNTLLEITLKDSLSDPMAEAKAEKIAKIPDEVSHVIAICMKRDEALRVPEIEEVCAVACAVQNMYLGLLNFDNVGGYWSTGAIAFSPNIHSFLKLSTNDKCLGFFYVGHIANKRTQAGRPPVQNHVEWMRNN